MTTLPKRHAHALTPRTCEYDLIWKKGHCRWNEIKDLEMIVDFQGGPISNDTEDTEEEIQTKEEAT